MYVKRTAASNKPRERHPPRCYAFERTGVPFPAVQFLRVCPAIGYRRVKEPRSVAECGLGGGLKLGSLYVGSYRHRQRVWGKQNESQDSNLSFTSEGIHVYLNSFGLLASGSRTLSEWTVTKLFTPCRSRRMRSHLRQPRTTTPGIRSILQPVRNDLSGDRCSWGRVKTTRSR